MTHCEPTSRSKFRVQNSFSRYSKFFAIMMCLLPVSPLGRAHRRTYLDWLLDYGKSSGQLGLA